MLQKLRQTLVSYALMASRDDSTVMHGNVVEPRKTAHGAAMVAIMASLFVVAHAGAPPHINVTWGFAALVILEACNAATGFAVSLLLRYHRGRADA